MPWLYLGFFFSNYCTFQYLWYWFILRMYFNFLYYLARYLFYLYYRFSTIIILFDLLTSFYYYLFIISPFLISLESLWLWWILYLETCFYLLFVVVLLMQFTGYLQYVTNLVSWPSTLAKYLFTFWYFLPNISAFFNFSLSPFLWLFRGTANEDPFVSFSLCQPAPLSAYQRMDALFEEYYMVYYLNVSIYFALVNSWLIML